MLCEDHKQGVHSSDTKCQQGDGGAEEWGWHSYAQSGVNSQDIYCTHLLMARITSANSHGP